MPTVPTYDGPQVRQNTLPQVRLASPEIPDVAGRQTQQLGAALSTAGQDVGRIAIDMQNRANQIRVDDALNQAKEAALNLTYGKEDGFTNLKGFDALNRPDGKALSQEYGDKLREQISNLSDNLGNDEQRRAFAQHANDIVTSFVGQTMQHESGEFKNYSLSTSEGIQSTALRDIALNWSNPSAVNSAVERIKAETYRQAQLLGKSAEWQDAQARKMTSAAHLEALSAALQNRNVTYADAYLKRYASQMNADDILSAQGHITKEMDVQVGTMAANDAMRVMQPRITVSDAERAFNIALGTESNHRQFGADGKPLTSPKGAIGIAQVMPTTAPEAAKLAGLPWDEQRYKNDESYNRALGLAYFQKQLQTNGGDLAKAYAAYNAGPVALAAAVKDGGDWLARLPTETQKYVKKNMAAYGAGEGQPARATFADIDSQLRADPRLADNPMRYKVARQAAEQQFEDQARAIKQRDEEAVATAMRGIIENGGRFSDLPAGVRGAVPPKEIDNLIGFAQKVAKGDDSTSEWLYAKLSRPEELAKLSDAQFYALRMELSEADFKHFAGERAKVNGSASGTNGPGDLNSQAIKSSLDERMRMLGVDPTPKDDGGADAARVGAIRRFVDQYFASAQKETGKKFTDAEVAQHLDGLFAKNATFRGWFSDSSGPMLTMKIGDIDRTTRRSIAEAFKRQGVDDPTDAQILNAYWNMLSARK